MTVHITIPDVAPDARYTATGGQTVFDIDFPFFTSTDIAVYKRAAALTASDDMTLLTLTTHYTVAGTSGYEKGYPGGTITLVSAADAGDEIYITRRMTPQRLTDFPTSGPFQITTLNTELDKIIALLQDLEADGDRGLRVPDWEAAPALLPNAGTRAGKYLMFDASGDPAMVSASATGSALLALEDVGDGTTTAYALPASVPGALALLVSVDGVVQLPAAYSVAGSTLTFSEAPPLNAIIDVRLLSDTGMQGPAGATGATGPAGPAGADGAPGPTDVTMLGDVTGASDACTVARIRGVAVSATPPTSGYLLSYNGTEWAPAAPAVVDLSGYAPLTGATFTGAVTAPQAGVVLKEDPANGAHAVTLKAAAATASDYTLRLPPAPPPGLGNNVLYGYDGGTLNWTDVTNLVDPTVLFSLDELGEPLSGTAVLLAYLTGSGMTGKVTLAEVAAWLGVTPGPQPYDIPVYIPDAPSASMICARIAAVRAFTLPSGLTGSVANAGVAATASTTFDIHKNTSPVGSLNFAAAATTGAFTFASSTSWAAGDVLRVIAPATPDATLSDISISFKGTRA